MPTASSKSVRDNRRKRAPERAAPFSFSVRLSRESGAIQLFPFAFETSPNDDGVHPSHARKMAKRLEETGKPFLYYENIDGGHSAAANQREAARRTALEFTYLARKLMDGK